MEGPFNPGNPAAVAIMVKAAGESWGVAIRVAGPWARSASYLVKGSRARWVLEYDPRMRLVSFEVYEDGLCVYGSDDLVA